MGSHSFPFSEGEEGFRRSYKNKNILFLTNLKSKFLPSTTYRRLYISNLDYLESLSYFNLQAIGNYNLTKEYVKGNIVELLTIFHVIS